MVGINAVELYFGSRFRGNYLQAWQGSRLGRTSTSKHYNIVVSKTFCFFLILPVHLTGSITSVLTH